MQHPILHQTLETNLLPFAWLTSFSPAHLFFFPSPIVFHLSKQNLGTNRLLSFLATHNNVKTNHIDTTDSEAIIPYLSDKTRLVLLETPTNPLMKVADIPRICEIVHAACPNALVVVDNTMMSPYLQKPLELGADIVYHSGTKYLSGHHDLMAGVVAVKDDAVAEVRKQLFVAYSGLGNPDLLDSCY